MASIQSRRSNGTIYFEIVETFRDGSNFNAPRHRVLASLGRHSTAWGAWAAAYDHVRRLIAERDAIVRCGQKPPARLVKSLGAVQQKLNKLDPFMNVEIADYATSPKFAGMNARAAAKATKLPVKFVQQARAVRHHPAMWTEVISYKTTLVDAISRIPAKTPKKRRAAKTRPVPAVAAVEPEPDEPPIQAYVSPEPDDDPAETDDGRSGGAGVVACFNAAVRLEGQPPRQPAPGSGVGSGSGLGSSLATAFRFAAVVSRNPSAMASRSATSRVTSLSPLTNRLMTDRSTRALSPIW